MKPEDNELFEDYQEEVEELKEEVLEAITQEVVFGFNDEGEIFDIILDMFYEEELDEDWLEKEIATIYKQRQKEAAQWSRPTDFDKLVAVFDQLNKEKIIALHRAGYTQSEGLEDVTEVAERIRENGILPIGYCFYHTQDLIGVVESNSLFLSFGGKKEDGQDILTGKRIVSLLHAQGFETAWNETMEQRIRINNITWQKFPDDEEYGMDRSVNILCFE